MGKLINMNATVEKNKTLQNILNQLDTVKDELAELLSVSEETETDSAGMDALTEALDALEDAAEMIGKFLWATDSSGMFIRQKFFQDNVIFF